MTVKEMTVLRPGEILPLYEAVGWTNYTNRPDLLERAFENSLAVLGAYDGDKLVGLLRAVGDGASVVFIQDILVYPAYQRRGIGTKLVQALLKRYEGVYQIHLMTDDTPKTVDFYQSLGFSKVEALGCCAFTKMKG